MEITGYRTRDVEEIVAGVVQKAIWEFQPAGKFCADNGRGRAGVAVGHISGSEICTEGMAPSGLMWTVVIGDVEPFHARRGGDVIRCGDAGMVVRSNVFHGGRGGASDKVLDRAVCARQCVIRKIASGGID